MKHLWASRFSKEIDKQVLDFTSSIALDKRLYSYDIQGSLAHVKMLSKCRIITAGEASRIAKGLKQIIKDIETKKMKFFDFDEDIHMAIEKRLISKIGKVGEKLHTGRSRNDQVSLDMRLYLRDEITMIIDLLKVFQKTIIKLAEQNIDVIMPGFTHLQHAQPVALSHHLMAYYFMLKRDVERMKDCLKRVNVMPLGAGALAGTELPIDRKYVAKLLEFPALSDNSIDTVSDRDFVIEFISASSVVAMHVSRLAEELIIWGSDEFSFVEMDDTFCTGSSIMPQKKNPDVAELMRGRTAQVYANLMGMLTVMKGLPLSYNRDMQEDKKYLFDTVDTLKATLGILPGLITNTTFNKARMKEVLGSGFLAATDISNYLVEKGVPFREAHAITGALVKYCIKNLKKLEDLSISELRKFSKKFNPDIFPRMNVENCVNNKQSLGGTSPSEILRVIKKEKKEL
ncbi:MAG: argininosuccinate lyase [bacterium]